MARYCSSWSPVAAVAASDRIQGPEAMTSVLASSFFFPYIPYLVFFFPPSSNAGISFSAKCNGRPQSRLSTCTVAAASVRINKGELEMPRFDSEME